MDLLTPARTWAAAELPPAEPIERHHHHHHHHHDDDHAPPRAMPLAQSVTMFLSVVGPFVGFVGAVILLWGRGVGAADLVAMVLMYCVAGYGVTIGFHRLLTHKSFETWRPVRILLAVFGSIGAQGAVIRWCATHRRHHQASDREGDPHSPHHHGDSPAGLLKGLWHAHVGWCFDRDPDDTARSVPDLLADPAMVRVDRLYFFWVFVGLALPAAMVGLWTGSWWGALSGMLWGGLARIFLMQHVTWSVNSVCHVWGSRPFRSGDHSANNFAVALLALGEGWHNNHHAFPTSARHGLFWWQFDSSYVLIRAMEKLRLAWSVRVPNEAALATKRVD